MCNNNVEWRSGLGVGWGVHNDRRDDLIVTPGLLRKVYMILNILVYILIVAFNVRFAGHWWGYNDRNQVINIYSIKIAETNGKFHQTFNIMRTLKGNKVVNHSDVVAPVGAAPTTSSFLT